jgi:4-amino-4-deoxy-L-arabinose transferase-like glycosyltransferase
VKPIEDKDEEIVDLESDRKKSRGESRPSRQTKDAVESEEPEKPQEQPVKEKKAFRININWVLILIILLGLLIRIGLLLMEKQVYVDGIHYLLQGENIRHGVWDTWDPNGGRWTVPPLYPLLIAFFRMLTSNLELAGRIASLAVSITIIPGIYLISKEFIGEKGGRWAAFITAIDPLCAHYSVITYAEPVFMALVVWCVWFSIRTINTEKKILPALFTGLFAFLAYLTKAFGLVLFIWGFFVLAYFLFKSARQDGNKILPLAAYIGVFVILSLPYWFFIISYLGYPAPDGKSQFEFSRLYAPTLEQEKVDPRYEGLIDDNYNYSIFSGESQYGKQPTGVLLKNYAKKYIQKLIEIFIDFPIKQVPPFENVRLTTPLFLMLLGLGLFAIPLSLCKSNVPRILLAWFPLWLFIAPLSFLEIRYFVPIVPLLIPFVAQGVLSFEDWIKNTILFRSERFRFLAFPMTVLIVLCFSLPSLTYKLTHQNDPDVFFNEYQTAGEFMKENYTGQKNQIAESAHMISYYAGMQGWVTPQTNYDGLIKFMLAHGIKFFAVDENLTIRKHSRPNLQWLFAFPPVETDELTPVYWDDEHAGHRVVIYKLNDKLIQAWNDGLISLKHPQE